MTVSMTLVQDKQRFEYEWQADRQLARDMLKFLRDSLAEHDATFATIEGIGVFRGPGSYTGLRIGMTVLNTIANTLSIPIVGSTDVDHWQEDCERRLGDREDQKIVLPEYGGEANITKPRK